MLAGRKLLLADDSVTIQKVVDLTFADEGVEVVTVADGTDAIDKVEELMPDIVLADIFMPGMTGYEVCEYIKGDEKLKHIPVVLLVGSFEPFDEAEARRVGADDTLTKPFQSIRRLIDKVGALVGGKGANGEEPTADLPTRDVEPTESELSTAELEITTADTLRLPLDSPHHRTPVEESALIEQNTRDQKQMDRTLSELTRAAEPGDVLLEFDEFEPGSRPVEGEEEEFILDLDFDIATETVPAAASVTHSVSTLIEPHSAQPQSVAWAQETDGAFQDTAKLPHPVDSARLEEPSFKPVSTVEPQTWPPLAGMTTENTERVATSVDQLSPEVIEAIARRAVEHLSEKVVQEIAWEVVPQLAELLIKRQLEDKAAQPK